MLVDASSLHNPRACASAGLITEFLRASRRVSDDNVRSRLGQAGCGQVVAEIYDEWRRRDGVLAYCGEISGQLRSAQQAVNEPRPLSWLVEHSRDQIQFPSTHTDPRVDAYSSRDEADPLVSESAFDWIAVERQSEAIIRDSTLKTITNRCGFDVPAYTDGEK